MKMNSAYNNFLEIFNNRLRISNEIKELEKQYNILTKELLNNYIEFIKQYLMKTYNDNSVMYICDNNNYYKLGKFEYLSWCGKKDAVRKQNYSNDYEANFKVLETFTESYNVISENKCEFINVHLPSYYKLELYTDEIYNTPHYRSYFTVITKQEYENKKQKIKDTLEKSKTNELHDINGNVLKTGTCINYYDKINKTINKGIINLIIGQFVFVNGRKFNPQNGKITAIK